MRMQRSLALTGDLLRVAPGDRGLALLLCFGSTYGEAALTSGFASEHKATASYTLTISHSSAKLEVSGWSRDRFRSTQKNGEDYWN